ncbi:MAG TPA: hypothetical protein VNF47_11255 [Streptosporangiaceae bacterium]|nr:hypothetical protein [Streptosporangiaceae bacterium]
MSPARERPATGQLALEDPVEHRVAELSASLLRAVMITYGETQEEFAARAGVAAEVVADALGGTCPAWALPYDEFTAIADAVAAIWPSAVFETAAACDLLLTCVLNGDHVMATDVLTDPCTQDLARALLRTAITTDVQDSLLPEDLITLLADRAAALADSGSPDAWVGAELLVACPRRQS